MSLIWTAEELDAMDQEMRDRALRATSWNRDYAKRWEVTHPHKPRIERPRIPPIAFVLLGLSAFWILVGMAVLNK